MYYRLDVHTGYYRLNLQWTTNIISNILFWCILPGTNKKLYCTLQYDQLMVMMVISIIDHSTYPWQHKVASNSKAPMFHYIEAICFTEKKVVIYDVLQQFIFTENCRQLVMTSDVYNKGYFSSAKFWVKIFRAKTNSNTPPDDIMYTSCREEVS